MRERFSRFMMGRYGTDEFSKFVLGLAVAVMVLNLFLRIGLLNTLVLVLLVYVYFRMFSRNIQKRYEENVKYLQMKGRIVSVFQKEKRMAQDRKVKARERSVSPVPNAGQSLQKRVDGKHYVWICVY